MNDLKELSTSTGAIDTVKVAVVTNLSRTIQELKEKGYNIILATNPIFPKVATLNRIKWANLNPNDFIYYFFIIFYIRFTV